jgi:hypothetical protein
VQARNLLVVAFTAVSACARVSSVDPAGTARVPPTLSDLAAVSDLTIRPVVSTASPSPMIEVRAGDIQAIVPHSWDAEPLPETRYPQQGFVASPKIGDWDEGSGMVRGMEIYWIDIAEVRIPSDLYYLVARGPALGGVATGKHCRVAKLEILVDHPPDLTGDQFSPGDYVASGEGTCKNRGNRTRWAYVVAAPGYGPAREVGIPTSGLYVVVAVVSGSRSDILLEHIMRGARFGNASIGQIVAHAAGAI